MNIDGNETRKREWTEGRNEGNKSDLIGYRNNLGQIKTVHFFADKRTWYKRSNTVDKVCVYKLVIGRGDLGRICTSSSTANIVHLAGLNTAATIAHEVFHK